MRVEVSGTTASNRDLVARTREVMIELTSRCDLRCSYCANSQPGNSGEDSSFDLEALLRSVERLCPHEVQLSGHGETTILPGWHTLAAKLIERGFPVTLTSNFARRFEDEEIAVLAELDQITVSCDSADPKIFRELRRGTELSIVEDNLRRLNEARDSTGERPYVAINCVLTPRSLPGLSQLVRWTAELGARCLSIVQFVEYESREEQSPHLRGCSLEADPTSELDRAARLAGELGISFNEMGGLRERGAAGVEGAAGQTRDCLDPWEKAYVRANGDVWLCCWSDPVGHLSKQSLEEILESDAARHMRSGLLDGNPAGPCATCRIRGLTSTSRLSRRVKALDDPALRPIGLDTRRRLRAHHHEREELLEDRGELQRERSQILKEYDALLQDRDRQARTREEILDYHEGMRASPVRLLRAFARACLAPFLRPRRAYWGRERSDSDSREL